MKKIILTVVVFAFLVEVSAQNVSAPFKINSLGQVGIGKDPQYKLDVAGDIRTTGNSIVSGSINAKNASVSGNIYGGSITSDLFRSTSGLPITFIVDDVIAGFTGCYYTNVSFGYGSLGENYMGINNTATGYQALYYNIDGSNNTAIGYQALYNNVDHSGNTAMGYQALYDNYGVSNTAIGSQALYYNKGHGNTATGVMALFHNEGYSNTATGTVALYYNTQGMSNTAIGDGALYFNSTGFYNTAIGSAALYTNKTGDFNTAIGCAAEVSLSNLTYATVIGTGAVATASNQVRIGNSSVTSIGGFAPWSNLSDGRAKKNMQANVPGLAFINHLQPITYNLDLDVIDDLLKIDKTKKDSITKELPQKLKDINKKAKEAKEKQVQTGFVAQDVEKVAKSIGYDFSGVEVDELGIYGLRYSEFVVPLVKAVQELSEQNDRLTETVKGQQSIINELIQKVEKLTPVISLRSGTEENAVMDSPDIVIKSCELYQNAPNPFNKETQIKFYLPENVQVAQLCIYNLQGMQIKQILLTQRGEGSQRISGSELVAGMYLYSLIADGKEVDTKRMILTK